MKDSLKKSKVLILGIDTSCDETSVSVLEDRKVLSQVVSSQVELHKKWGGVVPHVARRAHIENLPKAYKEALKRAKVTPEQINAVAVTYGPGLAVDLEVGVQFAKEWAQSYNKPIIPVNHMEGHLLSGLLLNSQGNGEISDNVLKEIFPALGMLISGKHTEIIYVTGFGKYEKIGWTIDDAAGEAFDKVGRILGFGYPAGPLVEEFAKKGRGGKFDFPLPLQHSGDLNFSYSGLKTACLYQANQLREAGKKDSEWVYDFCYEFQSSVARTIEIKLEKAILEHPEVKSILTGGGVYNNLTLVRRVGRLAKRYSLRFILPEQRFRSDNGSMIGIVGWRKWLDGDVLVGEGVSGVDRVPWLSL
ncbi:MAG: tRNA (adenosine(37)-N6)-threonylcarbamoyltransferase complex transferase subunit TsaD [Candidatus Dojkabacteria bacterium]